MSTRALRQALKDLAHLSSDGSLCWCDDGPCVVHDACCAEIRRLLQLGPVETRATQAPIEGTWPVRPVPTQVQEVLDL